ncbi:PAAR-like protein [Chitinophaga sp. Ak27]|uniref:PAAR-like protein n=1 Tax=Chitinophaga sp. Ak27 TaxID=2726116 RepID=UPI00145DF76D|nr:PAAR-like protein [Chitinophaga sp. Ak27]NLU92076.1 DUF4280 domain-containing protein [Chitinophaga sp. Ak27]
MADKHFVVQGATCKCDFAANTDKLVISGNNRDYINDGDGSEKPIASTKDTGTPLEAKTFGSCSKNNNNACVPSITAWQQPYEKVTLTNGGKVLTEDSKAVCATAGTPCISIVFHGQTAAVNSAHFDKVEVETMSALNPMAPKPANRREMPKVHTIKAVVEGRVPALELVSGSQKTDAVKVLIVRVDESINFSVKSYFNEAKADKDKVSWKILEGQGFEGAARDFNEAGPTLKMNFDVAGNYRVMAYGNEGDDTRCSLDVKVTVNKLKDRLSVGEGMGRLLKGSEQRIRRGVPVTVNADYEMKPATADEKKRVSMQVTDQAGNIVAATEPGNDKITFTPDNTATTYKVTATMAADTPDGAPQTVSQDMVSEANGVVAVTNDQQADVVRPGTTMSFKVSEMVYKTQVQDFESSMVKWQLNGRDVGTGSAISLDGRMHFMRPGKYVVEAYVMKADAWDARKGAPAGNHQKDDWRFEVKNNEVVQLEVEGGTTDWIVGKHYTLVAKTLMKYQRELDGPLTWVPNNNSSTEKNAGVYATHAGKFYMTATLGTSTKRLEVNAKYAAITRWCFGDKEGVYKSFAGWKETMKVLVSCPAAAGEKVNLHILEADKSSFNYIKDLGEATFDTNGDIKLDVKTDDLKPLLKKLYEWNEYDVCFGILQRPGGIEFADVKTVEAKGKKFWYPKKESNLRDKETGKYVYIDGTKEVVSVHFYDSKDYPAYKVYKYGEKIKIHIQTRNLGGEMLTLQLWENKYKEEDKLVLELTTKVGDQEILNIDLDTGKLKTGVKAKDDNLRAFYVIIKSKDADKFEFPKEVADKNTFNPKTISYYQHIKLSDGAADLLNKVTKDVAPTVLGEALEKEESSGGCPRCNEKITPATLKKMFPDATPESLQTTADIYNKYMKELGMNTCWNKAHFFAQIMVETGSTLHLKSGESFNWYWKSLIENFGAFQTTEGRAKAELWGRANEKPPHPGVTPENEKNIANYAYGPDAAKGRELGNTQANDGWNFRGKGPIQLTGRTAYDYANTYTKRENADIIADPDLVIKDLKIGVLSSMAFWKWKGLQNAANGNTEVTEKISKKVGKDAVTSDGKSSHAEKKKAFKETTSVVFKVSECLYGIIPAGDNNKYRIDVDLFTYQQIRINKESKQYQFDVYNKNALVKTYVINANEKTLLPFPETGPNWGRFGTRDAGGDNYAAPKVAAAFFGFFYSLPLNGYAGTLYYNDISANDGRNIGHQGHVHGDDMDIRYPGAAPDERYWYDAKAHYPSEEKFVETLENILTIALKWGFNTNYAYKAGIKHTKGVAMSVHQDHFHIGLR